LDANFTLRSTNSRVKSRLKLGSIVPPISAKIAGRVMLEAHDFCESTTPIPQSAALDSTRRWHATSNERRIGWTVQRRKIDAELC
jgi:hypothetical protein